MDNLGEPFELDLSFQLVTLGATIATTGGMSVGYVLWTIRAGHLISSLLVQMPAWRLVDPLPVLEVATVTDLPSDLGCREDDESLLSMVDASMES